MEVFETRQRDENETKNQIKLSRPEPEGPLARKVSKVETRGVFLKTQGVSHASPGSVGMLASIVAEQRLRKQQETRTSWSTFCLLVLNDDVIPSSTNVCCLPEDQRW